jgi:hypothetical protein
MAKTIESASQTKGERTTGEVTVRERGRRCITRHLDPRIDSEHSTLALAFVYKEPRAEQKRLHDLKRYQFC